MGANTIRNREEIEERYKWNLENIYPDEQLWEKDLEQISRLGGQVGELQGTLGESARHLRSCLQLSDDLGRISEKAYVYARMRRDENNANHHYQALFDRVQSLTIQVGSITSFIVPEILTIPEDKLRAFLDEDKDLGLYRHSIDEILRQKEHILSQAEERLMAMSADLSLASGSIFTMLNNADIKFPVIKDEKGQDVEITKGRYGSLMESSHRRVRQDAYQGLYSSYRSLINTLGASLSASVKKDIFYARVRKYQSARAASLDQDNVPVEVYDRLIESVHAKLDLMYRYMDIRKKVLELDELHFYDLYTPLVPEYKLEVPYEQARQTLLQALQPLGPDYLARMESGFRDGWIDVYENQGKTSGAYSWGAYDTNPYILMNYDNKL
ncbi:MAG: oligoendopeptidase F family protein, partial [Syntrophomonadaceae bacterium]|nr:oligoendopeptidase F family protein [Syntrophomonadaceae bacterium]